MEPNTLDRNRLIACREKLGITKQEAAKRMQLSQPAYLRYESGERSPSIHVIQIMANVLATSAAYLTGKSHNPNPDGYLIKSETDPELFFLIQKYRNSDTEIKKRLLSYLQRIFDEKEVIGNSEFQKQE